jgi:hypothetical protein
MGTTVLLLLLLRILQSFDWLATFHLELLQALFPLLYDCFCCKANTLWVVTFLQNRGENEYIFISLASHATSQFMQLSGKARDYLKECIW